MNDVKDELMHYGVPGMKWGKSNSRSISDNEKREKRSSKDFNNLKSKVSIASKDLNAFLKDRREHTYMIDGSTTGNRIVIDNPTLRNKATASSAKVDRMVSELSKKYENVSAIPNKDLTTGKMYVEVSLGSNFERLDFD